MGTLSTLVRATSAWTLTDVPDDTETCTIGGKVYTFQDTLTNVDGNVKIGASIPLTFDNLIAAMTLSGTGAAAAGTGYAAAMTVNPHCRPVSATATVLTVEAKVPGTIGNLIPSSDTHGEGSWTTTVLTGGLGSISTAISEIRRSCQVNAEVLQLLDKIDGSSAAEV